MSLILIPHEIYRYNLIIYIYYIYTYDVNTNANIYIYTYIYTIIHCTAGLGVSLPEASSEDPHPGWPPPTIRGSHQRMD